MTTVILWFRRDLRLGDNPALTAALTAGHRIVPVYIDDAESLGDWRPGAASRWWLHHSLAALDARLRQLGSRLIIRRGAALAELIRVAEAAGADRICWNRLYEPAERARDRAVKQELRERGYQVASFNAALLYEPWEVLRDDGEHYRVFTPFWKAVQRRGLDFAVEPSPQLLPPVSPEITGVTLDELGLLPRIAWDAGLRATWQIGEAPALHQLERFLDTGVANYHLLRDRPDRVGTSRLSPHLHFGEISPRQILDAIRRRPSAIGAEAFIRELAWREFAHHLLFHFPATVDQPLDPRYTVFPWAEDYGAGLAAWQRGQTGIPLVDAGMRELWHTGWMHNRVRMVVASLLTKNLLIPWTEGSRWFWDTLVDADLANNTLGWQWTAGCGADAAPYFRIFNPVLQGQRFDPEGSYVRRWLPELANLPTEWLHQPWQASERVLAAAGVNLDTTYPAPIVDLSSSRARALGAYEFIRGRDR